MQCDWKKEPQPEDGVWIAKCSRRGCQWVAKSLTPIESIAGPPCTGFPDDDEIAEWINYFEATFSLAKPDAICWYVKWRADGADLSELPHPSGRAPMAPAPDFGPGTELERIFHEAGAKSDQCGGLCAQWRDQMNRWGVAGCREHKGEIIAHIRNAMFKTWVADQMTAGWVSLSISREPWFTATEPIGCIVDEAIRRANTSSRIPA